jgi:protein-tyrosine phosphatase
MKKLIVIQLIIAIAVLTMSCLQNASQKDAQSENDIAPGQNLSIASVPNLRDVGGYTTKDGKMVARGVAYRSNELSHVSAEDIKKLAALRLKNDYDLRTEAEIANAPDEIPPGVVYTSLNVLADAKQSSAAMLGKLLHNPKEANEKLGGGKIDSIFIKGYREFVTLPSAKSAYRELFLSLSNPAKTPALFHCATGKDRTGCAAAALLTLLDVPHDVVMEDYLKSNDYIIPMYRKQIDGFVVAGGDSLIPLTMFGVKKEYLNASFDEMQKYYGTIEEYFSEGLGIDTKQQEKIRERFLKN